MFFFITRCYVYYSVDYTTAIHKASVFLSRSSAPVLYLIRLTFFHSPSSIMLLSETKMGHPERSATYTNIA